MQCVIILYLQKPDSGACRNIVLRLTCPIQVNKNHKINHDNFYSTVPVMLFLEKRGILSLGNVRHNHIKDSKLRPDNKFKLELKCMIFKFFANIDGIHLTNHAWKQQNCFHAFILC